MTGQESLIPAPAPWTRYDYEDGTSAWQRGCDKCERGMLMCPARFCRSCGGSGFVVTFEEPPDA